MQLPLSAALVADEAGHEEEADEAEDHPDEFGVEGRPIIRWMVAILVRLHELLYLILLIDQRVPYLLYGQLLHRFADLGLVLAEA
mgnify:CR=1 FL=1